jgi:hypothetical protein
MEDDWLAAFMMSSILLNPQLLFYSAALGPAALVIRFASCFLCGFRVPKNSDTDPNPVLRSLKILGEMLRLPAFTF